MRFVDELHLDYQARFQFVLDQMAKMFDLSEPYGFRTSFGWVVVIPAKRTIKVFNRFDKRLGTWNAKPNMATGNYIVSAVNWAENSLLELAILILKGKNPVILTGAAVKELLRDKKKVSSYDRDYRLKYEGRRYDFIRLVKKAVERRTK